MRKTKISLRYKKDIIEQNLLYKWCMVYMNNVQIPDINDYTRTVTSIVQVPALITELRDFKNGYCELIMLVCNIFEMKLMKYQTSYDRTDWKKLRKNSKIIPDYIKLWMLKENGLHEFEIKNLFPDLQIFRGNDESK